MRLSDIQPQYFPRLHYFARMLHSDVFVVRDDVQFVRNHRYPDGRRGVSYQAHTPIKAPDGAHLLTVAIKKAPAAPIHRTEVSYDQPWARKHINVLKSFYAGAPNQRRLLPEIEAILDRRYRTVAELDIATTCWALGRVLGAELRIPGDLSVDRINGLLEIERPRRVRLRRLGLGSIDLAGCTASDASARIAELCLRSGADEYMAGGTAVEAYLDRARFRDAGIELAVQRWSCPGYPQQFTRGAGHLANLSILDLLMNAPEAEVLSLLAGGLGQELRDAL